MVEGASCGCAQMRVTIGEGEHAWIIKVRRKASGARGFAGTGRCVGVNPSTAGSSKFWPRLPGYPSPEFLKFPSRATKKSLGDAEVAMWMAG
jgi:hypothetical protein